VLGLGSDEEGTAKQGTYLLEAISHALIVALVHSFHSVGQIHRSC
jgi:hypothetical protein